ncbi:MAG: PD40 domain-containing protein, partial [Anaerolineae bacterium]|nr:PD40 domain-containing protein [Anaerolineae bacterium]
MRIKFLMLIIIAALLIPALPVPAAIPAAAQGVCGTAPPPRMTVEQSGRVTVLQGGVGSNLRQTFASDAVVLGVMPQGEIFTVIGPAQCAESFWWWEVRRWNGQTGWTAEGITGDYWIEPWPYQNAVVAAGEVPTLPGARIAYINGSASGGNMTAFVMDATGANKTTRGGTVTQGESLRWSPDGTRLAVSDGNDIWLIDESNAINLTNTPQTLETWPTWSPDGLRIAYASNTNSQTDIFAQRLDDRTVINLTNHPAADWFPAWSPDGTRIVFSSDRGGNGTLDLFVMSAADGSNPVQIAISDLSPQSNENRPVWSPDGQWVAYEVDLAQGHTAIYASPATGVGTPALVSPDAFARYPTWSADGSRIAFAATVQGDSTRWEIFSARVDGSDLMQYTTNGGYVAGISWSPDGEYLTYASNVTGNYEVYLMHAGGYGLVNLTNNASDDMLPVFTRSPLAATGAANFSGGAVATPVPTLGVNLAEQDLLLIYDAAVRVFTLQNISGGGLNLVPLTFQGAGRTVSAGVWA